MREGRRALVVLVVLCGAFLAAACGSGGAPADRLTIALAEDPDELDPSVSSTFVARIVFVHMCEKLYDLDERPAASFRSSPRASRARAPTGAR